MITKLLTLLKMRKTQWYNPLPYSNTIMEKEDIEYVIYWVNSYFENLN